MDNLICGILEGLSGNSRTFLKDILLSCEWKEVSETMDGSIYVPAYAIYLSDYKHSKRYNGELLGIAFSKLYRELGLKGDLNSKTDGIYMKYVKDYFGKRQGSSLILRKYVFDELMKWSKEWEKRIDEQREEDRKFWAEVDRQKAIMSTDAFVAADNIDLSITTIRNMLIQVLDTMLSEDAVVTYSNINGLKLNKGNLMYLLRKHSDNIKENVNKVKRELLNAKPIDGL